MLTTVTTITGRASAVTSDAASPVESPADSERHETEPHEHSPDRPSVSTGTKRPSASMTSAGDLLRALAAPVRIAIVLELREADRCVHELVDSLGVAQPLISQHLRVLKAAGVVHGERNGREVVYRLVDEHLAHIVVDAVAHVEEGVNR
jgi:DNA-binding transcriptional ArsR family regulator